MGVVLLVGFLALLWVAAVLFAADSRDGHDWIPRTRASERPGRLGD